MARALSDADAVRARIAAAWLDRGDTRSSVGRFDLRAQQRATTAAVLRAIEQFGGALVADPPGTGKTVIALAVAAQLGASPLVVAPSALRTQWTQAAVDAAIAIQFVSFETLARSAPAGRWSLVIVDEAHHARTPSARRYARLAEICSSARVLLLSATPVVNRATDRDALLALFLGERATALDARELATVVIRRGDDAVRPSVRRLSALRGASDVAGLYEALAQLPPPLPAADGRAATELVRISLAMAWRSSLAALDAALRRREQRGMVIRDAVADGRWPDRSALRLWLVGEDATQLVLPVDFGRPAQQPRSDAAAAIGAHVAAIRGLRALIRDGVTPDTAARADALRALLEAHPARRVVCFAQYGATVRALWSALRRTPGVVAITGERVHAAAGRWSREEVLRALGPRAGVLRPRDPRAIRLLLSTDLLAEGVELQGVGVVVHGDAAWTPARLEQRVGRAVRVGSAEREILVTGFRAPVGARPLLALAARLARKRAARTQSLEATVNESRVSQLLERWRGEAATGEVCASVRGRRLSFVAVLERGTPAQPTLLSGRLVRGSWSLSDDPRATAAVIAGSCGPVQSVDRLHEAAARDEISKWERAQGADAALGHGGITGGVLCRRVRARVDRALQRISPANRSATARAWSRELDALALKPSVGTTRQVAALDRATPDDLAFAEAFVTLALSRVTEVLAPPMGARSRSAEPLRLLALLLVAPESRRADHITDGRHDHVGPVELDVMRGVQISSRLPDPLELPTRSPVTPK